VYQTTRTYSQEISKHDINSYVFFVNLRLDLDASFLWEKGEARLPKKYTSRTNTKENPCVSQRPRTAVPPGLAIGSRRISKDLAQYREFAIAQFATFQIEPTI